MKDFRNYVELIADNLVNEELPEDFSLPKPDNGALRFADGARDGITVYHTAPQGLTDEYREIMKTGFDSVGDAGAAIKIFRSLFDKISPMAAIDHIQRYLIENSSSCDMGEIYSFALKCLFYKDIDIVKLGLIILEIYEEPNDNGKSMIHILGLSDEFSVFVIFNMMRWSDANEWIYELAKHVHGWGRIHAVEKLAPENDEIRDWLVLEGYRNTIMYEYSALTVFEKAEVSKMLKGELSQEKFQSISDILGSLLNEGPVTGISGVSDAQEVYSDFLSQASSHSLTLDVCETVMNIMSYGFEGKIDDECEKILNSDECRKIVTEAIKDGKGLDLAQKLGIDTAQTVFGLMKKDLMTYGHLCGRAMKDPGDRDKTVALFTEQLPLKEIATGPEDCMGFGPEYAAHRTLLMCIQYLKEYPFTGTELVLTALSSPVINNRNMALGVISSWCKIKECSLQELSPEICKQVQELKKHEFVDSVKKNIETYGF